MPNLRLKLYRLKRNIINSAISLYSWRDKIPYYLGFKKAEQGSMPDFIIAGLPKCGTVWLVEALDADENFEYVKNPFFSHKGEIRFFSFNFIQPICNYFDAFKIRRTNGGKLLFEKSPDYSTMSRWRIRLIKKLNPEIKIILIFRDPIERAFSNAKMDLIRVRRIELKPENDHYFLANYKSQIPKYNYERIINNWFSVFDKSNLLILSMEDIKEKPREVLKRTHQFLGKEITSQFYGIEERKNVTISKSIPQTHRRFLDKNFSQSIEFWRRNQSLFRLK